MELAVDMRHITMRFPRVVANRDVNFSVRKGEIHALVGENGAGKSTLMNILYGLYQPTEGEVWVDGQKAQLHSAVDAIQLGIGMVHQHFMLIPRLTVAQNVVLGAEPRTGAVVNRSKMYDEVQQLSDRYGFPCLSGRRSGTSPWGCSSGWRSQRRSTARPTSSFWMSPLPF